MKSNLINLSGLAGALMASLASHASGYIIPTEKELRLLPPYCVKTAVISKHYGREQAPTGHDDETKQFISIYGKNFWNMHHYCFGLMHLNRAYGAKNRDEKGSNLGQAIKEFDYVLNGSDPEFVLLPEIHTNKGTVLMMQKMHGAAVGEFSKAIALKPDYPQPYGQLSDYYEENKKKDMALQILEQGLAHNPEARQLLKRYKRLGGKKVFAVQPAPDESKSTPREEVNPGAVAAEVPTNPAPSVPSLPQTTSTPPGPQQEGKPNPYCRFCP